MNIANLLRSFGVFHVNALHAIMYFIKYNVFFIVVVCSLFYLFVQELKVLNLNYVNDDRRIT
jgi:hypothetical protein